jgi:hypothetical protein
VYLNKKTKLVYFFKLNKCLKKSANGALTNRMPRKCAQAKFYMKRSITTEIAKKPFDKICFRENLKFT